MAGFGFGGALALSVAAKDDRVRGVATFAAPAHLQRGAARPTRSIARSKSLEWSVTPTICSSPQELYRRYPRDRSPRRDRQDSPRRLLIGHGTDDIEVPASDARDLVAAAEGRAELRLIQGAGHQLRADPRMVATLLGWLDRHR